MSKIHVKDSDIAIIQMNGKDYICITDMLKEKGGNFFMNDWLRNKNTLDFLAIWERLNNPDFNYGEFAIITNGAGRNSFKVSVKDLTERCNVNGIVSKTGRYGGTYAHKDIAFEFGMWISPEFKLLLIAEFQRLKDEETKRLIGSEWDYRRFLAKTNYILHTDAIKAHVIPALNISKDKECMVYADEADILNVALFGFTAKEWKEKNSDAALKGLNIRDMADAHELLVLSNLENLNSAMIQSNTDKYQRLVLLRKNAEFQLKSLRNSIYSLNKIQSPFKTRNID